MFGYIFVSVLYFDQIFQATLFDDGKIDLPALFVPDVPQFIAVSIPALEKMDAFEQCGSEWLYYPILQNSHGCFGVWGKMATIPVYPNLEHVVFLLLT